MRPASAPSSPCLRRPRRGALALGVLLGSIAQAPLAGVLPEDRADALYHSYEGGGVEVDGPSILVRKDIGTTVSVFGNWYMDFVSSASVDVITQGSPYKEERQETSTGIDYLHGKSTLNLAYTNSSESDYNADTLTFGFRTDMFGDLTTVSMGFSQGRDEVRKNGTPDFKEDVDRRSYRVGLSQILTKDLIFGLAFETISDEGYLHNPYRSYRYLDGTTDAYALEVYPETRTSNAVSASFSYYLPYRAAVHYDQRLFADSWGIEASDYQLAYTHPFGERWILDVRYRYYEQTAADFYSDLFPYQDAQNYLARDKELSTFNSQTFGLAASYLFLKGGWGFIDRGSLNLGYDHILFDYEDYRDTAVSGYDPGTEPLYSFSANVIKLFLSLWY